MTHQDTVLWLLRVYGPCSAATLRHHSRLSREALVSALTRVRRLGLAERCMRARYRLTDAGMERLERTPAEGGDRQMALFAASEAGECMTDRTEAERAARVKT